MANSIAIITGATSGIGASFARQLAARGNDLILVGRRKELLDQLANQLTSICNITAKVVICDLSTEEGIQTVESIIGHTPNLSFLVNNAGFGLSGKFAETNIQDDIKMIQVHVMATVRFTWKALAGMLVNKRGSIINVSSMSAILPLISGGVSYCATKSYLNTFTETLAKELRGSGVRVQALCPGVTHTEFHDRPGMAGTNVKTVPKIAWMTPDKVVELSLKALERNRVIYVPGLLNQFVSIVGRNPLFVWLADRVIESRRIKPV